MKRLLVAGIAAAAFSGAPVLAADMAVKAPPPPSVAAPASNWTGFYIGGNAGYGWSADPSVSFSPNQTTSSVANLTLLVGTPAPVSFPVSGAAGGLQLGYNWQVVPKWLIGFETDFDLSDVKGNGMSAIPAPFSLAHQPLGQTANERLDWFGTVRARLGYLLTNSVLLYGTGGFAYGRVAENISFSNPSAPGGSAGDGTCSAASTCYAGASGHIAEGWTAGAGVEYALTSQWTIKAEYLYVDLGGNSFNENVLAPGLIPPFASTSSFAAHYGDLTFQVARGGFNYRF